MTTSYLVQVRDVMCALVATCGRGLHLMCPTIAHGSIIHHFQVDHEPYISTRAARVRGSAKYVGPVEWGCLCA